MGNKGSTTGGLTSGTAIGAGLMYLADRDRGNRHRSFIRDQVVHGFRFLRDVTDEGIRDMRNRARGAAAEAWCAVKFVPKQVLAWRSGARLDDPKRQHRSLPLHCRSRHSDPIC